MWIGSAVASIVGVGGRWVVGDVEVVGGEVEAASVAGRVAVVAGCNQAKQEGVAERNQRSTSH